MDQDQAMSMKGVLGILCGGALAALALALIVLIVLGVFV